MGNQEGIISRLDIQSSDGQEAQWEVASLRRLHRLQQSLPKGQFPLLRID